MSVAAVTVWKESPFLRILPPFMAGIACERYAPCFDMPAWLLLTVSFCAAVVFSRAPLSFRYKNIWIPGVGIHILMVALGYLLAGVHDPSAHVKRLDNLLNKEAVWVVSLREPLVERPATWRGLAAMALVRHKDNVINGRTDMLLYFRKDSALTPPRYGDRIAFIKPPERIKNTGVPGGFDYKKYCADRNIYFQVFLQSGEFAVLSGRDMSWLKTGLLAVRDHITGILKRYIPGKKESGLAEALLIGYKDDVDRPLMQAYSLTGVVHVIAISGLHLGLIYLVLARLCRLFANFPGGRRLRPVMIITGLWLFSLLAGASPSVLRSAVMFTALVLGESFSKRTSVFNNLAASAFFLLGHSPRWLWDIGFQLSYSALLSLLIFRKPVYGLLATENRMLDQLWKLSAATLSAQVLTTPLCVFYFHQFPSLFLIANLIAVPLSGIILAGGIALCLISWLPLLAMPLGWLLGRLIKMMNSSVEWLASLRFSSWQGLHIDVGQLVLIYVFIACMSGWIMQQNKRLFFHGLVAAILFFIVRDLKIWS